MLRWWVAESNVFSEVQIGANVLNSARDSINKVPRSSNALCLVIDVYRAGPCWCHMTDNFSQLRNSLRFLLGNLQGFDPRVQAVEPADMHYIDQYMLHLLHKYSIKVSCSPSPSLPARSRSDALLVPRGYC